MGKGCRVENQAYKSPHAVKKTRNWSRWDAPLTSRCPIPNLFLFAVFEYSVLDEIVVDKLSVELVVKGIVVRLVAPGGYRWPMDAILVNGEKEAVCRGGGKKEST